MGPSNMFFSSSSPTVVLPPPRAPHQQHTSSPSPSRSPSTYNPSPFGSSTSWSQFTANRASSRTSSPFPASRGRKRSRDETDLEEDGSILAPAPSSLPTSTAIPAPIPIPEPAEPIYGEGMTLIQPNGFIISAGSQTGTWAEEVAASKPPPLAPAPASPPRSVPTPIEQQPRLLSRKSQRLDTSSSNSTPNTPPPSGILSTGVLSTSPTQTQSDPQIDYSTILLGIGWSSLPSTSTASVGSNGNGNGNGNSEATDPATAAAIRGWARYIANHFHGVTNPTILLRSAGLSAFLVHAEEGFFLFHEDLGEGRLVGRTEDEALGNLRRSPVGVVEGCGVLRAVGSPGKGSGDGSGDGDAMGDVDVGAGVGGEQEEAVMGGMELD